MAAGRAAPARRPVHRGRRAEADQAVEHRQARDSSSRATSRPASREADVVVEREFTHASRCTRAISSRTPALASCAADGQRDDLVQHAGPVHGPRLLRQAAAACDIAKIRVIAGRDRRRLRRQDLVYLEPLALLLSQKTGRPVKMVMTREEVFRATGPTSGAVMHGQDRRQEGRHASSPPRRDLIYPGRRLPGLAGAGRRHVRLRAATTSRTSRRSATTSSATGRRSRPIARRAPRSPRSRSNSVIDELAEQLGMDPLELRLKNAAKEGTKARLRRRPSARSASSETLEAVKNHAHYKAPLEGPASAAAASPPASGSTSAARPRAHAQRQRGRHRDAGRPGNPDIGGSRASLAMMAAEVLGIDSTRCGPIDRRHRLSRLHRPDRRQPRHLRHRHGRVTQAAEKVIGELKERAAKIWEIDPEAVELGGRRGVAGRRRTPASSSR